MKFLVDTHTHTNCSHHAFSTLEENIAAAKKIGLEAICMTNHAPSLPDSAHIWHFHTMFELPTIIDGIQIIKGAEANVLDVDGHLDIPTELQPRMEVMIASIHRPVYREKTKELHTKTWVNVIKNPYVTILGHTGNPLFDYDHEVVIEEAKKNNKCIEINNHTFAVRMGSYENCLNIAKACKKIGTKIVVGSDAHNSFQVGDFGTAMEIVKEAEIPEDLIMNLSAEKFNNYLKELRG